MRALAVLAVVVYHANEPWLPGGFLGVDVFFVISGYLITDQLCATWDRRGSGALRRFWVRRARRLVPALVVVLVVVTAVTAVVERDLLSGIGGDLLAAATFTSNWWYIVSGASYFAAFGTQPLFLHLWSLAVEEQFYLVWPLVLVVVLRWVRSRAARTCVGLVGACASLVAMIALHQPGGEVSRVYFGTDTHAVGLLVGAALAMAVPSARLVCGSRRAAGLVGVLGLLGLAGLGVMAVMLNGSSGFLYAGGFGVVAVLAGTAVVASVPSDGWFGRLLGWYPLRWIGVRSYGMYLWHMPVIVLITPAVGGSREVGTVSLVVLISLALAALSSRWVEEPIRRLGFVEVVRRAIGPVRTRGAAASRTTAVAGGLAVVLLASAGLVSAPPKNDLPSQIAAGESAAAATEPTAAPPSHGQHVPATAPSAGNPQHTPGTGVTAVGDSVMAAAGRTLRTKLPAAVVDTRIGRQMWDLPDIVRSLRDSGHLGSVVVVGLGTNGAFNHSTLTSVMRSIGPDRRVVLINVSVPKEWQDQVNATLAGASKQWPNVTVVDWHTAAQHHPDLFYDDHTHPRDPQGTQLYADAVADALPPEVR